MVRWKALTVLCRYQTASFGAARCFLVDEFISEKIKVREHNDNGAGAYYRCIALAYSESIGFQNYLRMAERSTTLQGVSFDPPQDSTRCFGGEAP